ncbi:MAG: PLP-dependent aminotransferase family protein, partial [Alphaproteobacteria bacterium]|nr:PLP-dependent aminotransferase family protein [Alphaproteobacteria bacterium]
MTSWTPTLGKARGPRYRAIADRLAADVVEGRLRTGDRLPTHRDLAWKLGVTVGTITRAYAEAERRGLIVGEVGRGTFIRERHVDAVLVPAAAAGIEPGFIDLSRNFPAEHGQSRAIAAALVEAAQANDLATLLGYATTTGLRHHREAGAQWLARDGFAVDPEDVVITGGAQHAMMLALNAVARPGDVVLTETLTFYGLKSIATMLSVRLAGVGCDDEGLLPDALDAACRLHAPKALYALPTLQNPTTATMSDARRRAIAETCRRHGVVIIEDDIYGFLPPSSPLPLAAYAPEITLHIVSLSKAIAPGIRIGFIAAPSAFHDRLAGGLRASLWMAPPVLAEVAARLIRDGTARKLAERQREEVVARQAIARRILAGATMMAPPHSLHLWLQLPEPWRREEFVAAA